MQETANNAPPFSVAGAAFRASLVATKTWDRQTAAQAGATYRLFVDACGDQPLISCTPQASEGKRMHGYAQFLNHKGRTIYKGANYFAAYERHFGPYINRPITFLEIGAGNGGSSEFWKGYFGPLARIVTLDINPACKEFEDEQVAVRIGDQSDTGFLQSVLDEFGAPDLILDDGSHIMQHVDASFDYLYPRMSRNGVYMIEDMHTAYWEEYGGGFKKPSSFVERFKGLIDGLNLRHIRDNDGSAQDIGAYCLSAYDSILVIEKASYINSKMTLIGDGRRVNIGAA